MSCYVINYENGAKKMRPVLSEAEYRALRDSEKQKAMVAAVRKGEEKMKMRLLQMNYSCLPNDDGTLKGSTRMSTSVGMDIDHIAKEQMVEVRDRILAKKDELGLLMLELSARGEGYHLVFRRRPELSQEENLQWASELLGVEFDKGAKDITRVFFTTTASEEDLIYLDEALFEQTLPLTPPQGRGVDSDADKEQSNNVKEIELQEHTTPLPCGGVGGGSTYLGIPYSSIIQKWWELYNDGQEPCSGNRNTLTFELAVNLRHICGFDRQLLNEVIPDYWEERPSKSPLKGDFLPTEGSSPFKGDRGGLEKMACIDSALAEKRTQMPKRLKEVLAALRTEALNGAGKADGTGAPDELVTALDEASAEDDRFYYNKLPKLPLGVRDSVEAVGPSLSLPVLTAICPAIGMLATGVRLDVHGKQNSLNLIAYIAGDFASGKGSIDPVVDAWTAEVKALDKMYQMQEDEWRAKKRAAKNKKEQPEEPKLPVRCLTLNNTVANLAERLANTEGRHAFSFTPEADTVAQKWKSAMSDFSVMLRQSYDGTLYEREARSVDAVNVHIDHLLWNVTMCGTPDALYRVVNNYTDGFQSRIAIARTPDNTFAPLDDDPPVLTDLQTEHIHQVAHLLPLMTGEVTLPKLEAKGREWVEQIRLETMKNDDKVRARQRFRICVTAQRMTCCLMLCKVAEALIAKHGFGGAEKQMKANPSLWKEMLLKAQTPQLLEVYDVVADYLLDNALYFFRDRIEQAFSSRDYVGAVGQDRQRIGKNDSIYSRLEVEFTFEQAVQHSVAIKGASVGRNQVKQMLKNWKRQGLIVQTEVLTYRKVS